MVTETSTSKPSSQSTTPPSSVDAAQGTTSSKPSKPVLPQDKIDDIVRALDPNGDGTIDKKEAERIARVAKDFITNLPPKTRKQIFNNIGSFLEEGKSGVDVADHIKQLTGLEIDKKSAAIIIGGLKDGASLSDAVSPSKIPTTNNSSIGSGR